MEIGDCNINFPAVSFSSIELNCSLKKGIRTALLFALLPVFSFGQGNLDAVFDTQDPLHIALSMSIKEVRKSKEDSTYISDKLYYAIAPGVNDSMKIGLKARGNFRLHECYFPPLWIKIKKSDSKGTLFEGHKKLKLVLPCNTAKASSDLILKEYLCYKLYEKISPYSFKTRLVKIDLTERRPKKEKMFQVKGILVEDIDKTAQRNSAKTVEVERIDPRTLHDTNALRFDLFQFMISNTDWSKASQHNSKLIFRQSKYIAIPYDFDLSGVVDAPYSIVSMVGEEKLPIQSVRDRYYRGYCQSVEITQYVRNEFLSKEKILMSLPDELKGELSDREISELKDYLRQFFEILKKDDLFNSQIPEHCRSL